MMKIAPVNRFGALHRVTLTEFRNYVPKDSSDPNPAMNDHVRGQLIRDLLSALGGTGVHPNMDFFVGRSHKNDNRDTLFIATGKGEGLLNTSDQALRGVIEGVMVDYISADKLNNIYSVNSDGRVGDFRLVEGPNPKVVVKDMIQDKPCELIFDSDQAFKSGWFSQIQGFQGAESSYTNKKKKLDKNAE